MIEALATVGKLIFLWFAVGVLGLAVACVVAFVLCSFTGFSWETCRFLRGRLSHRRIVLLPLLGALAVPGIAAAQEEPGEPPALQISLYMCDFNPRAPSGRPADGRTHDDPVAGELQRPDRAGAKGSLRERLGRNPDAADALAAAVWVQEAASAPVPTTEIVWDPTGLFSGANDWAPI
jgi:hypothetical protein